MDSASWNPAPDDYLETPETGVADLRGELGFDPGAVNELRLRFFLFNVTSTTWLC